MLGMRRFLILALLAAAFAPPPAPAQGTPDIVRLATLEWPPYTGSELPDHGISSAIARAALARAGIGLRVDFFPWQRAISMASSGPGYAGYFPEYYSDAVAAHFWLSDPIGSGPLGFVENVAAPVRWHALEDLAPYRIGIVLGYVNTAAFDRRVQAGRQPVDTARDDAQNLLKLAAGRNALAVIDRRVFDYLVRTDPQVHAVAGRLHFQPRLL
jgi:polar amino acid transport system substrate-binding protein